MSKTYYKLECSYFFCIFGYCLLYKIIETKSQNQKRIPDAEFVNSSVERKSTIAVLAKEPLVQYPAGNNGTLSGI